TRALLEARLAERPEDRNSLTALAWVYVCLGRNADALRVARQAADLLPIEKDALAGPFFLTGLAEIEARTGRAEDAVKILRQLIQCLRRRCARARKRGYRRSRFRRIREDCYNYWHRRRARVAFWKWELWAATARSGWGARCRRKVV